MPNSIRKRMARRRELEGEQPLGPRAVAQAEMALVEMTKSRAKRRPDVS
jgi:hypothetical protein